MGKIKPDVLNSHFRLYPEHRDFADAFLHIFDINHAKTINRFNTLLSCFLLEPSSIAKTSFGFDDEILLVYSAYEKLEARTIQAIEDVFSQQPYRSRANPLTFILVSENSDDGRWIEKYLLDHPQFRTPIPINKQSLCENKLNKWFVYNTLATHLFTRDIFDYQLPLDNDMYFFGRSRIVDEFVDSVRKAQNRGLFGLRKTGKTSLLFKVRRTLEESGIANVVYLDCKRPDIRSKNWQELLEYISFSILDKFKKSKDAFGKLSPAERFHKIVSEIGGDKLICVIFDEIEYITPFAKLDHHWKMDFINLWQMIWSIQSEHRRLSIIVAGVNPYVTEIDLIDGVQNPVFGIIKSETLTGLTREDTERMVTRIGRHMGMVFEEPAVDYLHLRYGGHPLLTRMACSYTHNVLKVQQVKRPCTITIKALQEKESDRDAELQFYCRHIVSELRDFYPDEYEILVWLAEGKIVEFLEFAYEPEWIHHLKGYGILAFSKTEAPKFRIPVLQRYIAVEAAREKNTNQPRFIHPPEKRNEWLHIRKTGIIAEFRALLSAIKASRKSNPYASEFLPESHRISEVTLCTNWDQFVAFITSMNIALCETVDDVHDKKYFHGTLKTEYTQLYNALLRIKTYRNNADHLRLNKSTESAFRQFLKIDFSGTEISRINEPYFALQQVVLDELFAALHMEINKLK